LLAAQNPSKHSTGSAGSVHRQEAEGKVTAPLVLADPEDEDAEAEAASCPFCLQMVPSAPDPVLDPGEQNFGQEAMSLTHAPVSHSTGTDAGQALRTTAPVAVEVFVELPITPMGPQRSALTTHERSAHSTVGAPAGRPGMSKQAFWGAHSE
jgi:hypothetical protein